MKTYSFQAFFTHLLGSKEEADMFALWAFGEHYRDLNDSLEFLESWNALHAELNLHPDGLIALDAPLMIDLYRTQKAT